MSAPVATPSPQLARVLDALGDRVRGMTGHDHTARCPAHEDQRASLTVADGRSGVVLRCHAGCAPRAIVEALGLALADLFPPKRTNGPGRIVATYLYVDEQGELLFEVVRFDPKDFRQRRPDPAGKDGWTWSLKGVRRVLYHLPAVLEAARAGGCVFVVEGEKDVAALERLGMVATCNPGGAGKWTGAYSESLRGARQVVVIADDDGPGRKHAAQVAASISQVVPDVRVLELPGGGKDADDWVAAGGTAEQLQALVEAAPPGEPDPRPASAGQRQGDDAQKKKRTQAEVLVDLAAGVDLFRDPDGVAYVTVGVRGHRETWRVRSSSFRTWLVGEFYAHEGGKVPGAQALVDALALLEGRAVHEGAQRAVFVRIGRVEDAVYLDIGDEGWRVVRITSSGWEVIDSEAAPVRFRRPGGLRPLPIPLRGGRLDELRQLLNVPPEKWVLVCGWLVGALRGCGPYYALALAGEQGSGKSFTATVLKLVIDPGDPERRTIPRGEHDLAIAGSNSLVMSYDNLSNMAEWLADALCRIATGGGFATRTLYSDADETLFNVCRPILLNGIPDLLGRPDLADRSLAVHLPTIPEENRRTERDLWAAFREMHARVLGALLDAVALGLAREGATTLERPPRMADAATWIEAAGPALGLGPGAFVAALSEVREEAVAQGFEADPLGQVVVEFVDGDEEWDGPATGLLRRLGDLAGDEARRAKTWPRNGSTLTGALRRLAPSLRHVGIEFGTRKGAKGSRSCYLRRCVGGALPPAGGGPPQGARHPLTPDADSVGWRGGAGGGLLQPLSGWAPASLGDFVEDPDTEWLNEH